MKQTNALMNDEKSATGASTPRRPIDHVRNERPHQKNRHQHRPDQSQQRHGKSIRHQMGGSFPSARPLFGLLGIPEDLLTDYAFRRFVQVFIKGALDLEELWPESLVDERGGCSQNDG